MTREEQKQIADFVRSYIHEIITESGADKNAHTNEVLRKVAEGIEALFAEPCEDCISRAEAIRIASGYCHWTNIPDELAKLPSVTPKQKWIPINEDDPSSFPEPGKYILLSFSNWMIPAVGEYRQTEDGGGNFFLTDSDDPLVKFGIFVNAWMPLPECYKED